MSERKLGLQFDRFMDEQVASEILWRGYFIDSKSWLVEAIENWMKFAESDPIRSGDPRLQVYAKVAIITFTVQAIEDFACMGYAYLRSLDEGPARIYEYVRDFAKPGLPKAKAEVGTVDKFFHKISNDNRSLTSVTGFEPDSEEFRATRDHLKSVQNFHDKYYRLYLKFKHGQAFVVLGTEPPAVYLIPDSVERKDGLVRFPSEANIVSVDEWKLASDLIIRVNGYFANLRTQSRRLFPEWQKEAAQLYSDLLRMWPEARKEYLRTRESATPKDNASEP